MAEVWAKMLGGDLFEACSAWTEEYPKVKPLAVQVMEAAGVDMSGHRPKLIKEIPNELDILITICLNPPPWGGAVSGGGGYAFGFFQR